LDISVETRQSLWDEKIIAIHFPCDKDDQLPETDNCSLNPSDYFSNGQNALQVFQEMAEYGGYVFAEYLNGCVVGKIEPKSNFFLFTGLWGDNQRQAILKALKLTQCTVVSPEKIIGTYARRPRQGTIRRWPKAAKAIEMLVKGEVGDCLWENLDFSRQETLCAEFLRLPEAAALELPMLKFLLLPVGRTLKAIDIYGLSGTGKKIFAQVTNHSYSNAEIKPKIEALKKYSEAKTELILFCEVENYLREDGIHVVPLKIVFQTFEKSDLGRLALTTG
jgi:hypothetical protein